MSKQKDPKAGAPLGPRQWNLTEAGPLGPWLPERTEKKKIMPKMAEWIIQNCNIHNRPIVNSSVKTVEDALNGGTWSCNGEPIIFAWDPVKLLAWLMDGQNRLWGCINSGKPLTTWVHFGVEEQDAFMTIDRGKNRTAASDLGIVGEKSVNLLSAVLTMLHLYDQGIRNTRLAASPKVDTKDLLATLEANPGVRDSIQWGANSSRRIKSPPRVNVLVHYLAGRGANARVLARRDEFFARLADGVGLPAGSPILALRNRLDTMESGTTSGSGLRRRGTVGIFQTLWVVINGWNAFLMGHEKSKIQMHFRDPVKQIPVDIPDVRSYLRRPSEKSQEAQVGEFFETAT